ncbi:hypothetical protein RJ639_043706 [Escallonia herrerae]|uniref:Uncharacterized protein n=1 Tax=Escallonia herrerae TaxID=1293975 RepID=A0AA88WED1_9ASTE|nr:hypothetical protein RJ639_043706 [Escallonia herrerae]
MNQEAVKVILECKKDIWKNQELFELVEEYFENNLQTLDFCAALEKCLKRAQGDGVKENRYTRTLEELRNFKAAGDPFTEDFFQIFQSVYRQQMLMLEKLQMRKSKRDKKLKSVHAWRKLSSVIFVATFAAVLICYVVAAAMAAPPVAAVLAAASSVPLGPMGKWIDSLFKNYETAVRAQKEALCFWVRFVTNMEPEPGEVDDLARREHEISHPLQIDTNMTDPNPPTPPKLNKVNLQTDLPPNYIESLPLKTQKPKEILYLHLKEGR